MINMDGVITKINSLSVQEAWSLTQKETEDEKNLRNDSINMYFLLFHGSWNGLNKSRKDLQEHKTVLLDHLAQLLQTLSIRSDISLSLSAVQVDTSDESLALSIDGNVFRCPSSLPSLALLATKDCQGITAYEHSNIDSRHFLSLSRMDLEIDKSSTFYTLLSKEIDITAHKVLNELYELTNKKTISNPSSSVSSATPVGMKRKLDELEDTNLQQSHEKIQVTSNNLARQSNLLAPPSEQGALRIFIAGDRSQVGKSSVCMGLLGTLLAPPYNYHPSTLAYIKPATQCEAPQLVAEFCKTHGIEARPVGPLVYYKGFTRAFLAGETEARDLLLEGVSQAVDEISNRKKVVIIDGVGYPAVGSICGTCNASVARASGYIIHGEKERVPAPVVIVGKSGVGDAVDSYNINSTYFHHNKVSVLGGVFNRLSTEGFYSLENCKLAVSDYFHKFKNHEQAFGFLPELSSISKSREESNEDPELKLKNPLEGAEEFVQIFGKNVDVGSILKAATAVKSKSFQTTFPPNTIHSQNQMVVENVVEPRLGSDGYVQNLLTREQIESAAKNAGAAGG